MALLQLTSGSTAEPKAVRITHGNLHANITAMMAAARLDLDRDVMVSWLPLFHDMGMVGFLTVPMVTGLELVSVTPADFLARPLLWAELISRHGGTVTAAPNFAYAVLARQLARADGPLDLSPLRIALNGAEPIDPDAVAAFTAAGARFGLRPESVLAAYGMAETALGVVVRAARHRAAGRPGRRRAAGGAPAGGARGRTARRAGSPGSGRRCRGSRCGWSATDGAVLGEREVGVLQLRGESVTPGYLTVDGPVRRPGRGRLAGHRRRGLPGRRRGRGLRPAQGRDHHGRAQHLPDRHRARGGGGRARAGRQRGRRAAAGRRRGRPAPGVVRGRGRVAQGGRRRGRAVDPQGRHRRGWCRRSACGRPRSWCCARARCRRPRPASCAARPPGSLLAAR